MQEKNLTGLTFGRWTVLEKIKIYQGKWRTAWKCVCQCGEVHIVTQDNLTSGKSLSCGCLTRETTSALRSSKRDLTGLRFGKWTVIEKVPTDDRRAHSSWRCICDCGTERIIAEYALINDKTKSCGCAAGDAISLAKTKHGDSKSKLYNIWTDIKSRCYDRNCSSYKDYGGRGITVCDDWINDYVAFMDWAYYNGYADGLTIDRIDNNSGYSPNNCRWVDRIVQNNNKRNNIIIEWMGEIHTLAQWCKLLNISYKKAHTRYRYYGWSAEEIFTIA